MKYVNLQKITDYDREEFGDKWLKELQLPKDQLDNPENLITQRFKYTSAYMRAIELLVDRGIPFGWNDNELAISFDKSFKLDLKKDKKIDRELACNLLNGNWDRIKPKTPGAAEDLVRCHCRFKNEGDYRLAIDLLNKANVPFTRGPEPLNISLYRSDLRIARKIHGAAGKSRNPKMEVQD